MPQTVDIHLGKIDFKMVYNEANPCDVDLAECLRRFGSPEPEVAHAMAHIARPGDTVIDGGANMGFFTVVLSKLVGDKGRVIAVEPGQNNLWELKHNISLNNLSNVTVVTKPLWGSHKKLPFYLYRHGGWNSVSKLDADYKVTELESVMLADLTMAAPRLVKLDIEGAEGETLSSLKAGTPFIIAEMNHKSLARLGWTRELVREMMQGHGYDMFLLRPDGVLPYYVPRNTEVVTEVETLNVLFSTPEDVGSVWSQMELIPE